jgi:2-aminoadipate transaminase
VAANLQIDAESATPIYRQLYENIRASILSGDFAQGHRLQPTRELADQLGLNRTTVAAAYELLEQDGLIRGHVGRGSFVSTPAIRAAGANGTIHFATSRPAEDIFPLDAFRETAAEVLSDAHLPQLLQLGSPQGYLPLRRYLGPGEVLITSGAQQALDLIQRVYAPPGAAVFVEDPAYPGSKNVFERAGARLTPLAEIADPPPGGALLIVTPNFQNPTGRTLGLAAREQLLRRAANLGLTVVEIDIYSALRYRGQPLPSLYELDPRGQVLQIGSFSKVAFPGLRTGWIRGPQEPIARLTEAKQWSDLHSDQLSQAILLRFAESGRLRRHQERVIAHGRRQLEAALAALETEMPAGTRFTRPDGGMNLWVELPPDLDAEALAEEAHRAGVTYLPARYFQAGRVDRHAFRLSFGGLTPARIARGIERLGGVFRRQTAGTAPEPATAIV